MTHRSANSCLSFAVLCLSLVPSSVLALTADEVWSEAQRLSREADVEITGVTRREGDRLVLTNIAIPFGPPTDRADLKLDRIDLQELPDGTVSVILPPVFPVTLDVRASDPDFDLLVLTASAPDFSMVIGGIGDLAEVELLAPSLAVSLEMVVPALGVDERLDMNLAIADLAVSLKLDLVAATKTVVSSLRLGTLHGDLLAKVDDETDSVDLALDVSGIAGSLNALVPASVDEQRVNETMAGNNPLPDLLRIFDDGLSMGAELTFDQFALNGNVGRPGETGTVEMTSEGGKAAGRLDAKAASYDIGLGKTVMAARGLPDMEFPEVSVSITELGYGISIGIGDLVSPQQARLSARLTDLTIPPEVWAKTDPTGALGSEPLSYAVDISATYALSPEMLDPAWRPDPDSFPPIDLVDVTLRQLMFRGAGMSLDGSGALTFDETDLTTYPGFPAPEGTVGFKATGIYSLLDRIVAAGLVSNEELSGFRLGLMFIAKAGDAPDSLVSNVEFRDKRFYLNGLKIR